MKMYSYSSTIQYSSFFMTKPQGTSLSNHGFCGYWQPSKKTDASFDHLAMKFVSSESKQRERRLFVRAESVVAVDVDENLTSENGGGNSNEIYDAVVIGSGIGGLVAATQLAVKGGRVLVLEKHTFPGGSAGFYQKDGYTFDVGASVMFGFSDKRARDLSGPPTLTEVVQFNIEKSKDTQQRPMNGEEADADIDKKRGQKRKLDSEESSENGVEDAVSSFQELAKIKKAKNIAISMATKAAVLARELKSMKSDLCFMQERCSFLEEENQKLRIGISKDLLPEAHQGRSRIKQRSSDIS